MIPFGYQAHRNYVTCDTSWWVAEELNVREAAATPASVSSETFVSVYRSAARPPGRTSLEFAPARPALACPLGWSESRGQPDARRSRRASTNRNPKSLPRFAEGNRAAI